MKDDDDLKRRRRVAELGDDVLRIMRELDLPPPSAGDEYWEARDAEIAAARQAELRQAMANRLSLRANLLRDPNGPAGFPLVAVEGAVRVEQGAGRSTPAIERVREFVEARRVSLELAGGVGLRTAIVLAGGVGSGKSTAATWFALMSNDSAPAFLRATEIEARGRYDRKLRDWLRTRSSLVIDDLGAEVQDRKGVFASLLGEVVDLFYGDRKPLVMTTNLLKRCREGTDEPQFVERYGTRIESRLREAGGWADCGALDLRSVTRP